MSAQVKVVLGCLYGAATIAGTCAVYSATKRDDYAPVTNSSLNSKGDLKTGKTLKKGESFNIRFQTADGTKYRIVTFCPQSKKVNINEEDCTSSNNLIKQKLVREK